MTTTITVKSASSTNSEFTVRSDLPATDRGPGKARQVLRGVFASWAIADELQQALLLVASELVTNAVRHAGRGVELVATKVGESVLLEVADGRPDRMPVAGSASADDECGRGLLLVGQMSQAFGWYLQRNAKVVWARVEVRPGGRT